VTPALRQRLVNLGGLVVALAVWALYAVYLSPTHGWTFFFQLTVNGIILGSVYALIALGYSMVYGILKLLNFAHGDVYMIGAFIGFGVLTLLGGPLNPAIPVVLLIACMFAIAMIGAGLLGLAIDLCATRRESHRSSPRSGLRSSWRTPRSCCSAPSSATTTGSIWSATTASTSAATAGSSSSTSASSSSSDRSS
jgi:hypothetical protein